MANTRAASTGAFSVKANWALDTVATPKPNVSSDSAKRPTCCFCPMAIVISTAAMTGKNNHGCKIHGGRCPIKRLRNVPPDTDAMAAINKIPP